MPFFPFCAKNNATLMQTGSSYLTYSTVIIEKDVFSSCHERGTDSSKLCREAGHLKDYLKCTQLNNPDLAHKKREFFHLSD